MVGARTPGKGSPAGAWTSPPPGRIIRPVTATLVLALLAAALLLSLAWTAFAARWRVAREPDAWLEVTAADGHPVSLACFRARALVDGVRREPVILCHGVSANRFNMDLDDEVSLARWLAARGFDCYVLELRGRGKSVRRGLAGLFPRQAFDDYPALDLPAAIEAVRRRHGAEQVHWVGHSMGGQVLYAYLARTPGAPVRSAVTIGSPIAMRLPLWMRAGLRAAALVPAPVCWGKAAFLVAPVVGWVAHPPLPLLVNPQNIRGARLRSATANLIADVSWGEVEHFARMGAGAFGSRDGAHDYAAGLARAATPCLVVAGAGDRLATPDAVRAGFLALGGGPPHAFRLAGEAGGDPVDFGHGDLVLGDHAPTVVFPEVQRWLEAHDPACVASVAALGARV